MMIKKLVLKTKIGRILLFYYSFFRYYKKDSKLFNSEKISLKPGRGIFFLLAPGYSNLGDVAIFLSSINFIKERCSLPIKGILYSQQCISSKRLKSLCITPSDIIVLQGGGNMGDLYTGEEYVRQNIVKLFPKNKIISFPQTVYYSQGDYSYISERAKKIYSKHKHLYIFVRDIKSTAYCKKTFTVNSFLCPDMVLSNLPSRKTDYKKNKKVLMCIRSDVESNLNKEAISYIEKLLNQKGYTYDYWDTDDCSGLNIENKELAIENVKNKMENYQFVITDRFHGTIFSYITKTPCISIDNSYSKIKNGYIWFEDSNYMYFADTITDIDKYISVIENLDNFKTNENLISSFNQLRDCINE